MHDKLLLSVIASKCSKIDELIGPFLDINDHLTRRPQHLTSKFGSTLKFCVMPFKFQNYNNLGSFDMLTLRQLEKED